MFDWNLIRFFSLFSSGQIFNFAGSNLHECCLVPATQHLCMSWACTLLCLSICLSVCLFLSFFLPGCVSVSFSRRRFASLYFSMPVCPPLFVLLCPSVFLSFNVCIILLFSLSLVLYLSAFLCLFSSQPLCILLSISLSLCFSLSLFRMTGTMHKYKQTEICEKDKLEVQINFPLRSKC